MCLYNCNAPPSANPFTMTSLLSSTPLIACVPAHNNIPLLFLMLAVFPPAYVMQLGGYLLLFPCWQPKKFPFSCILPPLNYYELPHDDRTAELPLGTIAVQLPHRCTSSLLQCTFFTLWQCHSSGSPLYIVIFLHKSICTSWFTGQDHCVCSNSCGISINNILHVNGFCCQ